MSLPPYESVRDCPKCNRSFYVSKGDFKGSIAHAECKHNEERSDTPENMYRKCSFCGYGWFEDIYRPEQEALPLPSR